MKTTVTGIAGVLSLSALAALTGARANAELAPPKQSAPAGAGDRLASQSAEAELTGDHQKALQLADEAIKTDPSEPWGYYDRGDALGYLGRVDDAVAAFGEAAMRFPEPDTWGKSVALWGQANALSQVGRCQEATPAFERYATFVEKVDRGAAAMARQFALHCTPRPAAR